MIVGLGVLPVVIGLTMAIPAKSQRQNKAVAAFAPLLGVSLVILTAYVSVKGAYQAAVFEARVEERNLLPYAAPVDCARVLRGNPRAPRSGHSPSPQP